MENRHDSVLMKEVLAALAVKPSDTVVDATLGGAGHFKALLATLGEAGTIVGIDADAEAVARAREAYSLDARADRPVVHLVNDNFRNIEHILTRLSIGVVDAALFDLGWSGHQIASLRGFSFSGVPEQPLLMTYVASPLEAGGTTAADLINRASEDELADILFTYGEEHYSRGIARAIVTARAKEHILSTTALVSAVKAGTPRSYHTRRIHPATKTFQAIRIAVNDEIGALQEGLSAAIRVLRPGGRLAVISFHSVEDRAVKTILRDAERAGAGTIAPKKPLVPTRAEILSNRRARSAKLRVFERSTMPIASPIATATPFSYA